MPVLTTCWKWTPTETVLQPKSALHPSKIGSYIQQRRVGVGLFPDRPLWNKGKWRKLVVLELQWQEAAARFANLRSPTAKVDEVGNIE